MNVVICIAIFQVLVALYLVLTSQVKNKSKIFLYGLIFVAFAHFSIKASLLLLLKNEFLFCNLVTGFTYTYALLIYMYIKEFFKTNQTSLRSNRYHIIGFVFAFVFYFIFTFIIFINYSIDIVLLYKKIALFTIIFPFYGYSLASIRLIYSQRLKSPQKYKSALPIMGLLSILIIILISSFISVKLLPSQWHLSDNVLRITMYTLLVTMVIFLVQHHYKSSKLVSNIAIENPDETPKIKYENFKLKPHQLEDYSIKLERLMKQQKLYMNADLTLERLAENVEVPKHHLTQLLNEHFNKNFYQFVNGFRIEEVKERLKIDTKTSILEIAYASGFNSKSSFNTYFKSNTGHTPTKYRELISY